MLHNVLASTTVARSRLGWIVVASSGTCGCICCAAFCCVAEIETGQAVVACCASQPEAMGICMHAMLQLATAIHSMCHSSLNGGDEQQHHYYASTLHLMRWQAIAQLRSSLERITHIPAGLCCEPGMSLVPIKVHRCSTSQPALAWASVCCRAPAAAGCSGSLAAH
jgi:hypothetical protein